MTLKAKFLLLVSVAVLLALLLSEWLTVGLTETFLKRHELEMQAQYGNSVLVESLKRDRQTLIDRLVLVHLLIAATIVCLLVVVMHIAWKHLVHQAGESAAASHVSNGARDLADRGCRRQQR